MTQKVAEHLGSTVTLSSGTLMPMFGLGTSCLATGGEAERAVTWALDAGYRLIDTAYRYGNEDDVGRAVKRSHIPREEIFLTTKVWDAFCGKIECKNACRRSIKTMGLDYLDLYLIHSPRGGHIVDTYDALLELKDEGLIRSVGVSNFNVQHLIGLEEAGRPRPSVNQFELHPYIYKRRSPIVDYCLEKGIIIEGYSPLAKVYNVDDPNMQVIAERYNKTVTQLMIRWSVQHGFITIPKSANQQRIQENTKVFDWKISSEDMNILDTTFPDFGCTWDPTGEPWQG